MDLKGTIYEAGGTILRPNEKTFIERFMEKPEDFDLKDGETNLDYNSDRARHGKKNPWHGRKDDKGNASKEGSLVAFEVEPGFWSLCLAKEPEVVICQIDHAEQAFRQGDIDYSSLARTAFNYADLLYKKLYSPDRKVEKGEKNPISYEKTTDIYTHAAYPVASKKFLEKLDVNALLKKFHLNF